MYSPRMQTIKRTVTTDLHVGDTVDTFGVVRTVTALLDTGRPTVFGSGSEWHVSLDDRAPTAAASDYKWNVVG